MGSLYLIVRQVNPEPLKQMGDAKTRESLALARDALFDFIARDDTVSSYGLMPLPDLGEIGVPYPNSALANASCTTEGCAKINPNGAANSPAADVGRFPWQTVGSERFRDNTGECLWYAVSSNVKAVKQSGVIVNADTLGNLDAASLNDSSAFAARADNDAPIALLIAPGLPGTDQTRSYDSATYCGGDYDKTHFLDSTNDIGLPITSDQLFSVLRRNSNYRAKINTLLDSLTDCTRDRLLNAETISNGHPGSGTCFTNLPSLSQNLAKFQDQLFVARCTSPTCTATYTDDAGANQSCSGPAVLLYAGQRNTEAGIAVPVQQRASVAQKALAENYLESTNLASFNNAGNTFTGHQSFRMLRQIRLGDESKPVAQQQRIEQKKYQDIVRCVPASASTTAATSSALGANQIVNYTPGSQTLTLGKANIISGAGYASSALYGCAWATDAHALGQGFRRYFTMSFANLGNVGSTGFTFAAVDAAKNGLTSCGATGSQLGYSGNNGVTPTVTYPKFAIEFDQSRNGTYSLTGVNPGRLDPPLDGSSVGCAASAYATHAAIVYWGHEVNNTPDAVTAPNNDDNVHGYPRAGSLTGTRKPPTNPTCGTTDPVTLLPGIKMFQDMRTANYTWYVRVETTPTRVIDTVTPENSYTSMHTEVWIERNSTTGVTGTPVTPTVVAAMQDTTAPMRTLCDVGKKNACLSGNTCPSADQSCHVDGYCYLTTACFPEISDTAKMFDVKESACATGGICPSGQTCGTDNYCYRPAMETVRLGYTNSQNTNDQSITIGNISTTWLQ